MKEIMMGDQEKAKLIYTLLVEHFGEPTWNPDDEPETAVIDELIHTILSANTNDVNSGRAFTQLQERFGADWDQVRLAPLDTIKEAIRPAGMYNQKAPNIVATLEHIIADRGNYDLRFLAAMPIAEAMAYLTALPGVGHKTASIVMLFCFNREAFPVDTHIQRISQRVGIGGRRSTPEQLKKQWEALLPPETYYTLHLNLIRHGRTICDARTPQCEVCPLQTLCDYYHGTGAWAETAG
ncbi:MAG: endonuclease III [Caldilineaceae bacterium]|nr:endonuclease III [Caldilineaceae bacterium]